MVLLLVDVPGLAEGRGREHHEMARVRTSGRERARVAHAEVIGAETRAVERRASRALDPGEVALAGLQRGHCLAELPVDSRRQHALLRGEILIARAHREPVGLAHRGCADDLHAQAQVRDHAANHGELLEVLLAEDRHVGIDDVEQLGHHGGDALEMAGTELTTENAGDPRHFDARRLRGTIGIDLAHLGHEHEIAAGVLEHLRILRGRAWIVREVLVGAELHGVDEDAGDELVAMRARGFDETHVPRMQVAHGGHEHHAQLLRVPRRHLRAHIGNGGDRQHRRSLHGQAALHAWNSCSGPG